MNKSVHKFTLLISFNNPYEFMNLTTLMNQNNTYWSRKVR